MIHGGDIYRQEVNTDHSVNLNPYPVPDGVKDALRYSIDSCGQYPDITQEDVRRELALAEGVKVNEVLAGNGASELIMAAVRAVSPKKALLIQPSFYGYKHALLSLDDCVVEEYCLKRENGFEIGTDIAEMINDDTDVIFLCDPWNPTGKNIDDGVLKVILDSAQAHNCYVILDHSFFQMSDKGESGSDVRSLTDRYDRLIIIKSFTKLFAMPGIRMGYIISSEANTGRIKRMLPEWNLSVVAQQVMIEGAKTVRSGSFISNSIAYIKKEREYLKTELIDAGYEVTDSDTSYILIRGNRGLYESLLDKKIMIRDCSDMTGLGPGYYRIAVRRHEDNEELIKAIREVTYGD